MESNGGQLPPGHKLVSNLKRSWDRIQAKAKALLSEGADEPYEWRHRTIHDLRKTYGTHLQRHVSAFDLKRLLGHSSLKTTETYYVGASDGLDVKIAAAFGSKRRAQDAPEVAEVQKPHS